MTAAILADFKTNPYLHQLIEFEAHCESVARAMLWQMRTGKTKVIIDTACHLFKEDKIDAVLVFAPNGVHENWVHRELPIHHWDTVERDEFTWQTTRSGDADYEAEFRRVLKSDKLAWFSFANETMTRPDVRRFVSHVSKKRRILGVFDESHDFRTPGSKRTKMARSVAKRCLYRRTLTGTPFDNSPLHAFSQYELLEPGALGFRTYELFKDRYAVYKQGYNRRTKRSYPTLDKYINQDELASKIAKWSSAVLRSDCEDLPDLIPIRREIELTEEQKRLYEELHHLFEFEINNETVTIGENTQKLVKLQQVVSGFMMDEFGDVHDIPGGNPRLEALIEEVELCAGKVVVWCAFREDMDRVCEALRARKHEVVEYHGRVNAVDKKKAREAFAPGAENDVKALVGYPTAGLDLSEAEKIMWYSHTFDAIKRQQADERATAMGGQNVPVIDFVAPGVDAYILSNVKDKVSIADALSRDGLKEVLKRIRV